MSERLKFLLISPSVIASDPRVLAHLSILSRYGDVTTAGYGSPPSGVEAHVQVADGTSYLPIEVLTRFRRIPRNPLQIVNLCFRRFDTAARKTAFTRRVVFETKEPRFDLICTNDVHAVRAGFHIAKQNKCPIWVDMHEYAPLEGESDWRWRVTLKRYAGYIVKKYLSQVDVVTTVGQGIKDRYESDLGRSVLLIRNTSPYVDATRFAKRGADSEPLRLVHVGAAIRARRLETMLDAVNGIDEVILDLYLVPTDQKYYNDLQTMIQGLENIRLKEKVDLHKVVPTITAYDVGIISIAPTSFNYKHCLPNKFFQYLQARLPVISSPIPEIETIINRFQIGWITQDDNAHSLRQVVKSLVKNRELLSQARENLDKAAREFSREADDKVRDAIVRQMISQQIGKSRDR